MRETKRHYFIFSIIELFPLLVRFSPLKYFSTLRKNNCNYPLTTTQGASCGNIVLISFKRNMYGK